MADPGSQRFTALLCTVSDDQVEPLPLSFMRDMFVNRGTGGLNDYWGSVSGRVTDLDRTDVYDRKPLDQTWDEYLATSVSWRDKIDRTIAAFPRSTSAKYVGVRVRGCLGLQAARISITS